MTVSRGSVWVQSFSTQILTNILAYVKYLYVSAYLLGGSSAEDVNKVIFIECINPEGLNKLLSEYFHGGRQYRRERIKEPAWIFSDLCAILSCPELMERLSSEHRRCVSNRIS